ncbi:MAG: phosphoribosylglycinamide formyltransferase [Rhodospirillaceae bacterium]|nr:phosphoribosylglycinamide formyltransferase [Rhodospirillaceae bacterium]MBT4118812.1 phosphoribosylglycinamide formyltransferase [Rhodospirillaceae bacterium]MBT4671653.1 phosphoribosylglycinamide formyltransferase [Rhodospirillaceae bacterium]MBT4748280.1 phosphoribosylglycinamide formyltransferase [Rhodospirillaceae bacterium]MBT5181006.1 phosphoribosylglycinamide formyltransferase [Rhodospirillaceae bacterium]
MRVGVLISGRGSNLQSLIDARDAGSLPVELVSVISNVAGAPGLERAKAAGITSNVVDHKKFDGRAPFEDALSAALLDADVEFLCLAGFMRLLTDGFVNKWQDRLINIHPSLLPAFKGLDTHARAIEAGVRFAGCTVHFVRPTMDEGPIIVQAAVPILSGDTPASLGERVLAEEHKIYPLALRLIAEERATVDGARVIIDGADAAMEAVINPPG